MGYMLSDIDYMSGKVRWLCEAPEEDMLTVVWPGGLVLYAGASFDRFTVELIKDNEHGVPFAVSSAAGLEELYTLVERAVLLAENESRSCTPHTGGLWKTREI